MWNKRYGGKEYAYGQEANLFVKQELSGLTPGTILFPAEGEGRNAVFAAINGWEVTAFDPSTEGKRKAELLAAKHNVKINYLLQSYDEISFERESFDCIVLVFAHMPPEKREEYHQKLLECLKPGGTIILEGFSKDQLGKKSGGPQIPDMLFSEMELKNDFMYLSVVDIKETETILDEGPYHQGEASTIRLTGKK